MDASPSNVPSIFARFNFAVFGVGGALWVLVLGRVIEGLTAGGISALYAYVADTHGPAERTPPCRCWWPGSRSSRLATGCSSHPQAR